MIEIIDYEFYHNNIPEEFDGYEIVFLTDVHRGTMISKKFTDRVVDMANELEPSIILLGGDYVDDRDPKHVYSVFESLSGLKSKEGIYAVMGNHDIWVSKDLVAEEMEKANIVLLDNNGIRIKKEESSIYLGGLADRMEDILDMTKIHREITEDDFVIIISHHPDVGKFVSVEGVDLIVSGHTHGGQITFFGLFGIIYPTMGGQKYRTGVTEYKGTTIITSNGLGVTGLPLRFFAKPQIWRITLRSN